MSNIQFTTNIPDPKIGQINSSTEYDLKSVSISKSNIIKIVCNSPFRGEAISAYDETVSSTFKQNYNDQNTSPYIVKQFDDRGYVTAWGYLLRFVPGDTQQTFYIEVQEGEFTIKNGVIFNNKKAKDSVDVSGGKLFGYGSSIREISTLTNVFKITSVYVSGAQYTYRWEGTGYSDAVIEWDFGSFNGGNYLHLKQRKLKSDGSGDYISQNADSTDEIIATGKIIAVLVGSAGTGGSTVSVIVDFNKDVSEWAYDTQNNKYYVEDINATSPCARYFADTSEKLTQGSTLVQEITFSDSVDVTAITYVPTVTGSSPSNKVYQYDWRFTRQINDGADVYEGIDPTQSSQGLVEGSVLSWFSYTKQLYVILSGSQFRIENGTIYQRAAASGIQYLGGSGIQSISQPITGFFLNIKQEYQPAVFGSFLISSDNYVFQQVSADENRGWFPDQQYTEGTTVVQYNEDDETDYILARVVKWIHPNSIGESLYTPSRLILEYPLIEAKKFNFMLNSGIYENKIVPVNQNRSDWKYALKNVVITGAGMVAGEQYNTNQLLNSDNYRQQLLDEGTAFYVNGPRINDFGVKLATCGIRNIIPTTTENVYNLSLFSILPNDGFEIGDIKKYFDSITYSSTLNTNSLFSVNTDSVAVNYLTIDQNVNGILEIGDTITTSSGSFAVINSINKADEDDLTVLRKLVVKRSLASEAIRANETIQTITRRGTEYNISSRVLKVTSNVPLSDIFIGNENSNGLMYRLQGGDYFSVVKSPTDIHYNKLIYSRFTGTSSIATFQETQFGDLLFSPSSSDNYILYKSTDGTIKKAGNELIFYNNINNIQTITVRKPADIANSNFIFNGHFKGSLNANYRIKDLETKTNEYRKLIYDDLTQTWYSYLSLSDIDELVEIVKENADATTSKNLIEYFNLDNGQRDDIYSFGKISLRNDKVKEFFELLGLSQSDYATTQSLILKISYTYFLHRRQNNNGVDFATATASGPIIRESYVYGTSVEQPTGTLLPLEKIGFYNLDGKEHHLSSILDFRPILKLENGVTLAVDESPLDANTEIDHLFCPTENIYGLQNTFYLSRIDNIYVNKNKEFVVQEGVPSVNPTAPTGDSKYGMHIYTINVPGYTIRTQDIQYRRIENKRYTMRDIGKLETRINNLEYYTSLSLLEKEAADMIIKDADGNTRDKNGIIVDSFISHAVGDVTNPDYNCAVDFSLGYLRPPFKTVRLDLITDGSGRQANFIETYSSNVSNTFYIQRVGTGVYMLPFTEEMFIQQPLATQEQFLAPFDSVQYEGKITLVPNVDDWVDVTRKPDVTVNIDGSKDAWEKMVDILNNNNLAPWGTKWSEWQEVPGTRSRTIQNRGHARGGGGVAQDLIKYEESRTRLEGTKLVEKVDTTDLGDKVVDFDIKHYTRPQTINIYCTGMKPNTRLFAFYDGVNVEEYCEVVTSDLNRTGAITSGDTETVAKFTDRVNLPTGPKTDKNGNVHVRFNLPEGKFRTGDKQFVITDNPQNNRYAESTMMYAFSTFSSSGLSVTKQRDIISVKSYDFAKDYTPVQQEREIQKVVTWDPLAQTFFVDAATYPNGIFISSIDLCFGDKDENIPVRVEIRPVNNGYPDSDKIYPNAIAVMPASQIKSLNELDLDPNLNDADAVTTFTFDTPVYLTPGQHAIVIRSDSKAYTTYVAQMGRNDIRTNQRVTENPYQGVFFKSANASTWQADGNIDLMFKINKCAFETGVRSHAFTVKTTKDWNNSFENSYGSTIQYSTYELFNPSIKYIDFPTGRAKFTAFITPNEGGTPNENIEVLAKSDIYLDTPHKIKLLDGDNGNTIGFVMTLDVNNTSKDVSPVIDLHQSGVFFVRNMVDTSEMNATGTPKTEIINNELLPKNVLKTGTLSKTTPASVHYMTKPVSLADGFTAKNIKVYLSTCLPPNTHIEVFVKAKPTTVKDNFNDYSYRKLTYNGNKFVSVDENDYREMLFEFDEDIEEFNQFSIKICLYTSNSAYVPRVKDMRAIAVL